ncbi:CopK family periplasmic copper-binding protein [Rhodoferax bucti]|uniref:CopK family periplasmic copper-binding protein n=1 Tax=Rhodoferax bucti TaxID=2576305 RepID=UPI001108D7EA|nr:CopK family periplasmic copper-binding protein [Rhodoferax bucti]
MSIRKSVIALALAVPFASAFSMDIAIDKSIPLKDGSVVHQFKNGKMAMEDKYGRPTRMNVGETMTAADGTTITMNSDEVALLASVIRDHYGRPVK